MSVIEKRVALLATILAVVIILLPVTAVGKDDAITPVSREEILDPQEDTKPEAVDQTVKTMIVKATAYTHTGNMTYTETWPRVGTIAVDPNIIPFGSIIEVPGYGIGIAGDTGGLIKGDIIDLFMDTEKEAITWGRRLVKIRVILPEEKGTMSVATTQCQEP